MNKTILSWSYQCKCLVVWSNV